LIKRDKGETMFVHNKRDRIEFKCEKVDYKTGKEIGGKLIRVAIAKGNCVGLAHNQVGGDKRVFVAKVGKNNTWKIFINPEIVFYEGNIIDSVEGCMTFPKKENKVKRYHKVELSHQVNEYDNYKAGFQADLFFGKNSHIIQHEMDHLNGIHIFNKKEVKCNG
jgi:peptide deformylase